MPDDISAPRGRRHTRWTILLGLLLAGIMLRGTAFGPWVGITFFTAVSVVVAQGSGGVERRLAPILIIGFFLRFGGAVVDGALHLFPKIDQSTYHLAATTYSSIWQGADAPPAWWSTNVAVYGHLLGGVYFLFGPAMLLARAFSAFQGVVAILLLYGVASNTVGRRAATAAAAAYAVLPSMVYVQGEILRDPTIHGLILATTLAAIILVRGGSAGADRLVAAGTVAAGVVGLWLFREPTVLVLVAPLALLLAGRALQTGRAVRNTAVACTAIAAVVVVFVASRFRNMLGDLAGFTHYRAQWATGGSAYLVDRTFESLWQVLLFVPLGALFFLFTPFPWQVHNWFAALALVENLVFLWPLAVLAVPQMVRRRRDPACVALVALLMTGAVLFGLVEGNIGTALRHRTQFTWVFILFAAPAIVVLWDRHAHKVPFLRPHTPHPRRLLLVINDPSTFFPARHHLAEAAQRKGWDVHVAGPPGEVMDRIASAGLPYHEIRMDRRNLRPWAELPTLWSLVRVCRRLRPTVVHSFALKPVLHGGLAARVTGVPASVATVTGLGYLFIGTTRKVRIARWAVARGLRVALDHPRNVTVFQNTDDRDVFTRLGIVDVAHTRIVPGSGVDTDVYRPSAEPDGPVTFVLAGRMLRDKGVEEFVAAARLLRGRGVQARFVLVGDTDPSNRAAISEAEMAAWTGEGAVEWWRHRDDMSAVYAQAHVVVLPSYREGIPRTLLEGAASGRPLIATDVPGCRDVCRDGVDGLLVPPKDPAALADAMERLAGDAGLRNRMGREGRRIVVDEFGREAVEASQLGIYADLGGAAPATQRTAAAPAQAPG